MCVYVLVDEYVGLFIICISKPAHILTLKVNKWIYRCHMTEHNQIPCKCIISSQCPCLALLTHLHLTLDEAGDDCLQSCGAPSCGWNHLGSRFSMVRGRFSDRAAEMETHQFSSGNVCVTEKAVGKGLQIKCHRPMKWKCYKCSLNYWKVIWTPLLTCRHKLLHTMHGKRQRTYRLWIMNLDPFKLL